MKNSRIKIKFQLGLILGLLVISTSSNAVAVTVPAPSNVHVTFGKPSVTELPSDLKIIVWNTYKGAKPGWQQDFETLTQNADLFIMQEATSHTLMTDIFNKASLGQFWNFATSFINSHSERTGVATGSIAQPISVQYLRSKHLEPILNTPKMTLFTKYKIKNTNKELLVVNIHAVNFNFLKITEALRHQLQEANKVIALHNGPVIFAGDFNTWLLARTRTMNRSMKKAKLSHVLFHADPRSVLLDHVFARGIKLIDAKVLDQYDTSDHYPLYLEISIL